MEWFFAIVRIAGAFFPGTSSLVQLQAELDTKSFGERLKKLEDPISTLHEHVPDVSREIYTKVQGAETNSVSLDDSSCTQFSRPLAVLESAGFIRGSHAVGKRFAAGLRIEDPTYILYMCSLFEDESKMKKLFETVDSCHQGKTLRAQDVMRETSLSNPVVVAMFKVFEAKGYGICSKELGLNQSYMGTA